MPDRRFRVLASHPVQYHAPIFRRIAKHSALDLHVVYCTLRGAEVSHDPDFDASIQWDVPLLDGYSWTHAPNRGSGAESFFGLFNPALWKRLRGGNYDAVLCFVGYVRATCQLWILTFIRRFLCARATANITPTLWLGGLLRLPHAQAIPHGLDFPQAILRAPDPHRPPVCAFVGRLVTTKGVQVLLEAAVILRAQNQPFELVIIGDGPQRAALEEFVRWAQLDARVKFAGRLGNAEVDAVLAEASAVVVPSLGGEVFGLVVAEAMARGLPVIASDLGAFAEVLGDAGLVFRYRLLSVLERRIYTDPRISLAAVSPRTASHLKEYFHRQDVRVVPNGVDTAQFSPATRLALRAESRRRRNLQEGDFVLLLIGNDWRVKGLDTVLRSVSTLREFQIFVIAAGDDSPDSFRPLASHSAFWIAAVLSLLVAMSSISMPPPISTLVPVAKTPSACQ